jgi:hypothetical protein
MTHNPIVWRHNPALNENPKFGKATMMGLGMVPILCLRALSLHPRMSVPMPPNVIGKELTACHTLWCHHGATQLRDLTQNKWAIPMNQNMWMLELYISNA